MRPRSMRFGVFVYTPESGPQMYRDLSWEHLSKENPPEFAETVWAALRRDWHYDDSDGSVRVVYFREP